jgi:hypothetical protein
VDVPILVAPGQEVAGGRPVQPDRPDEPVVFEGALAEDLRQTTGRGAQRELDLEEPFSGGHDALREPQVVEGLGIDPRHAERVATDRGGTFKAAELERALLGEE